VPEGPTLRPIVVPLAVAALGLAVLGASARAHHGSADYHVDREISVTGEVREWRWANPHTWVFLTVVTEDGVTEAWDGEGPPLAWAAQRGWSADTLRAGERVTLVMYPSRRSARSGLVKRIERESGPSLPVERPWLSGG
jgi:hypothetical protein